MSCLLNDDSLKTVERDLCPSLKVNKGLSPMFCIVPLFILRPIVLLSCVWQLLFSGRVRPSRKLVISNAVSIFSRSTIWDEFRVKTGHVAPCACTVLRILGSFETDLVAFVATSLVRGSVCALFLVVNGCLTWLCTRFLENMGIIRTSETRGLLMLPDTVRSELSERITRLLVKRGTKGVDDWENNGEVVLD